MLRKRIISVLMINDGVLFRTKNFNPDYRYTLNFVDSWNIDEIVMLDITRKKTIESENNFFKIVETVASKCFVPMAVGGGIRSIKDVSKFMDSGADKVVINTGAIRDPSIITEISKSYGMQSLVLSVDFKKVSTEKNRFEVFSDFGSNPTGLDPLSWCKKGESYGAGEIIINSIDRDGSLMGYEIDLCKLLSKELTIPILISGGAGNWKHFEEGFVKGNADAVCTSNIYHFTETSINSAKKYLKSKNISIRT
jgi:cyclase